MTMALIVLTAVALIAAVHYATRFYPPFQGYELERRHRRLSTVLFAISAGAGLAAIVLLDR